MNANTAASQSIVCETSKTPADVMRPTWNNEQSPSMGDLQGQLLRGQFCLPKPISFLFVPIVICSARRATKPCQAGFRRQTCHVKSKHLKMFFFQTELVISDGFNVRGGLERNLKGGCGEAFCGCCFVVFFEGGLL